MTIAPEFLPNTIKPRQVLFVAFPDIGLLDLTGAQTVFWAATRAMEKRGLPGYTRVTGSLEGGLVQTAEGLVVETVKLASLARSPVDTLMVPGSPHIAQVLERSAPLVRWLRRTAARSRRVASVCSGAFLLAEAGLLDNKRAVTHWGMCGVLKEKFPSIDIDIDAIFVQQGKVWTSAGVSAGIDLALALVEADCGHEVAMEVARELVIYLKRPGGQSQFSELLQSQSDDSGDFETINLWITRNLRSNKLSVEHLADRARMSPRNFARVYKQKTGRTPAKAVEVFRLEAAKRLLEDSGKRIEQIAVLCGFGDEERMRVTFQRNLGIAPRDYRQRFAA